MEKELTAPSTPAQYGKKMKHQQGKLVDPNGYRKRVGAALYINTTSRLEISNCVRELSQHMQNPGPDQWNQL